MSWDFQSKTSMKFWRMNAALWQPAAENTDTSLIVSVLLMVFPWQNSAFHAANSFSCSQPQHIQVLTFTDVSILSDCLFESPVWVLVLLENNIRTGSNRIWSAWVEERSSWFLSIEMRPYNWENCSSNKRGIVMVEKMNQDKFGFTSCPFSMSY